MLETILIPLITAVSLSLGQYAAKMKSGDEFDVKKFGRTVAAGVVMGFVAYFTGNEPSLSDPESVGVLVAGTGFIDVVSKYIIKLVKKNKD